MNPTQLSRELRTAQTPEMTRRRWIVGLSIVGTVAGQLVALYQVGVIKHLPDPPIPIFDSSRVDASDYAYKRYNTPDGLLMIITYGVTAALAGAGGKDRARTNPTLPIAMGAKLLYDALLTIKLGSEEWQDNKALCAYCQAATIATLVSVGLAVPEVIEAVRNLLGNTSNEDVQPFAERARERVDSLFGGAK